MSPLSAVLTGAEGAFARRSDLRSTQSGRRRNRESPGQVFSEFETHRPALRNRLGVGDSPLPDQTGRRPALSGAASAQHDACAACHTYNTGGGWQASKKSGYLVDPASSHMLVSKTKPCMCKYEPLIR